MLYVLGFVCSYSGSAKPWLADTVGEACLSPFFAEQTSRVFELGSNPTCDSWAISDHRLRFIRHEQGFREHLRW